MKQIAWAISVLFHPLFIFFYLAAIIMVINPYDFGVARWQLKGDLLLQVGIFTAAMPVIFVLMLKAVGFVDNILLESPKERIIPYAFTGLLYLWLYQNLVSNPEIPQVMTTVLLGVILTIFLSFFINNFSKVSAHTAGMGGFLAAIIGILHGYSYHQYSVKVGMLQMTGNWLVFGVIVLSGLVGTARLILGAHTLKEVYRGYFLGIIGQILAFLYYFW